MSFGPEQSSRKLFSNLTNQPRSAMAAAAGSSTSSSIFSQRNSSPSDDTVFFSIFPDSSITSSNASAGTSDEADELQSLHLRIIRHIAPITATYIWQHEPFSLSRTLSPIPRLAGHLRFGDNLEDEWFVVYLLFEISKTFLDVSIRVWDSDGEFLLIETAFHLPKWLNPETSVNRVFIRGAHLHIIPKSRFPSTPSLEVSLRFLVSGGDTSESRAPDGMHLRLSRKISEYPERAYRNVHKARVTVPTSVAWVLKHEPCLISLAVEGFYDRDIDSMKYAARMERFLPKRKEEKMVEVVVRMSRAMYAQLVQQKFQAPSCYPMPERSMGKYLESELGMKITCGFEMMYQLRMKQGKGGEGSSWEAFKESLERSGYFEGLLPGSQKYKRRMETAGEYYSNSSLRFRASEALNAPVKSINELLALPHSACDFKNQELPPSDDDFWLYGGDDEISSALEERQKEMELHDLKCKKKQESKTQHGGVTTSGKVLDEYSLVGIAKSMQAFVDKVSSFEGAEVPNDRKLKGVDFDVDEFMRSMEKVMGHPGSNDDCSDPDLEGGSSSQLDFDDSENGSEYSEDMEEVEDGFMSSYADALNNELKATTLDKTFVHAHEQSSTQNDEGAVGVTGDEIEDLRPMDVDFNLVKNLLDSYSSQEGMPGPASNLMGLMGLRLPDNGADKGK